MKKDTELEIFALCERLTELLGDKEAIADLKLLQKLHPEMFKNMQEVSTLIQEVVSEPEIIIKNPSPKSEKDYIAGKKLNDKKMGEVGVRQDENIVKIFHANKKRLKNLDLLAKKEVVADGRDAHTPYTQAQSLDGRLVDNNISSTTNDIIPHYPLTQEELQRRLNINLNNHRRVSDEKQKQEYLVRANAIKEQAKKQHIALDSKSLKALEKANLIKSNTNIKER
ncbi:hypothetical protein [Helicobacter cinaedi]|uniref:hypothetical protein n=1 Tax=Helicobacter cinaedi TaxID=213 RepID=UPI001FB207FC|nr:hypothetical protein [Helicobacter cinaedi]